MIYRVIFDAVTCLFSGIGYTKTPDRMQSAIVSMSKHVKPGGVLVVEPWFAPDQWKVGKPSSVFVDQPDLKIARVNISEQAGNVSIIDFHFTVATPGHIEDFRELHELGLFTTEQYLQGFEKAGLEVKHDPLEKVNNPFHLELRGLSQSGNP